MHYRYFFLFSFPILLTLALPSFAPVDESRFFQTMNPLGNVTLGISPTNHDPKHSFHVPFNSLGRRDPSNSLIKPDFFYIPNAIDLPSADRVHYITVLDVTDLKGTNDIDYRITLRTTDIECQCFKDKDGQQVLGVSFTAQYLPKGPGHLIPDTEPIESIFCSDRRGLFDYLRNEGVALTGSNKLPTIVTQNIISTVTAAPTPRPQM